MRRLRTGLALAAAVVVALADLTGAAAPEATSAATPAATPADDYRWALPDWMPRPVVPADNPMSAAKAELGRHLFYDKRLSADGSIACASCHLQARAFTDGRQLPLGVHGTPGVRNAMSLGNVAYLPVLTWANPNLKRLERQLLVPLFGETPVEMGMAGQEARLLDTLRADPRYPALFRAAYPERAGTPDLVSLATISRALATFERTLLSFDAPYDRYKYGGRPDAISASAKRGEALFFSERLECAHCHGGFNFTDNNLHARLADAESGFHNTGLYNRDGHGGYPAGNHGLREFTGDPADEGRMRTPSLRNVAVTAPYMHDGSIATLREVLRDHYAIQGRAASGPHGPSPLRSEFIEGFTLSAQELDDVVAFLEALTDHGFLTDPRLADPWPAGGAAAR